jgi:hypothetical protein
MKPDACRCQTKKTQVGIKEFNTQTQSYLFAYLELP